MEYCLQPWVSWSFLQNSMKARITDNIPWIIYIYIYIYIYKDLVLNNLQGLIYDKTQPTNLCAISKQSFVIAKDPLPTSTYGQVKL